jgi:RNA polymerase-binding transcription factor DksA
MSVAHINEQQRAALRARLLARARVLLEEIGAVLATQSRRDQPLDAASIGEADAGVASMRRDGDELRDVQDALLRLERGTYGLCVDCGAALTHVRLDAVPQAPRCVHCETERERTRAVPTSLSL